MLQEANIEKFRYFVVADVQLFELFESHNSLHLFQFTSSNVQHSDRFKTGSNISKTRNNGIIEFKKLQTGQNLSRHLQIMAPGIDS
jgi:hypothetical protein